MRRKNNRELIIGVVVIIVAFLAVVYFSSMKHADEAVTNPETSTSQSATPDTPTKSAPDPATSTSEEPTSSSSPQAKRAALSLYYVAVGDNGTSGEKIGCGDSLVMTNTGKVSFTDQVKVSFERLLANHEQHLGASGLYNALAGSRLTFVSSSVDGDTVTVNLTGTLKSGGTCDDPRIIMQLRRTATVAAGVGNAVVKVDGTPVEKLLSSK